MAVKKQNKSSAKKPRHTMAASSKRRGLRAIDPTASSKLIAEGGLFLLKTGVLLALGYFLWNKYTNRFVELKYNKNYPDANITEAQAVTRAEAIYSSIGWVSNSFDTVANNLTGLNYNGFVRLYNAFGKHTGTLLGGELDLIAWIKNQFSEYEVEQLSFLLNGAFF